MLKNRDLYLFGGSLNPSGMHHLHMIETVQNLCTGDDLIVIVPCGMRPDKDTTNDIDPIHRAAMCVMTFAGMERVIIDLSDLESDEFTRTWDLEERYQRLYPNARIWHVIGGDLIKNGRIGNSDIHKWHKGADLLNRSHFLIFPREEELDKDDLPYHHKVIETKISGSSTQIRKRRMERQCIGDLVTPKVAGYIARWHLYTGRSVFGKTIFQPKGPALIYSIPPDAQNPNSERETRVRHLKKIVERTYADRTGEPDHIIVIGGDGWMIDQIMEHKHRHLPIIGLNAGTIGYLLNGGTEHDLEERLRRGVFKLYQQPLLHVRWKDVQAKEQEGCTFNEVFLRAMEDQAAWMRVDINKKTRFEKIVGDGIMVSTPAGSSGWNRSLGGQAILIGTDQMVITGAGTTYGHLNRWVTGNIPASSIVEVEALGGTKRPMRIVMSGRSCGTVTQATIKQSRAHSVEIGFFPETDPAEKLMELYFPH